MYYVDYPIQKVVMKLGIYLTGKRYELSFVNIVVIKK